MGQKAPNFAVRIVPGGLCIPYPSTSQKRSVRTLETGRRARAGIRNDMITSEFDPVALGSFIHFR